MTLDAPFDSALFAAASDLDLGRWIGISLLCAHFDVLCFVFLPFAARVVPATVDSGVRWLPGKRLTKRVNPFKDCCCAIAGGPA